MRAFTLVIVFIGAAGCGAWLGLLAISLAGMVAFRTSLLVDLLAALVAVGTLMVVVVFVRLTELRITLLHLILVAVFATLNVVAAVYLIGPSWVICPSETEMVSASATLMVQVAPSFEACQEPGLLDGYPVWVVAMIVMLPSLLLASLEARLAIQR